MPDGRRVIPFRRDRAAVPLPILHPRSWEQNAGALKSGAPSSFSKPDNEETCVAAFSWKRCFPSSGRFANCIMVSEPTLSGLSLGLSQAQTSSEVTHLFRVRELLFPEQLDLQKYQRSFRVAREVVVPSRSSLDSPEMYRREAVLGVHPACAGFRCRAWKKGQTRCRSESDPLEFQAEDQPAERLGVQLSHPTERRGIAIAEAIYCAVTD